MSAKKYPTESARLKAQQKSSTELYQEFFGGPAKPTRKKRTVPDPIRKLPTPKVIPAGDPSETHF